MILSPQTLLNFHKALISSQHQKIQGSTQKRKPGRKGLNQDIINAIIEMKRRNPRFGSPKIAHQINLSFGINIARGQVRHVLLKHGKPSGNSGPSWLTFLGHAKDSLWSVDFFKCHSVTLKGYWIMVVMDLHSRRIIGFGINENAPDGIAACRMFMNPQQDNQTLVT